jgi:molybdopterin-guanine dinucleotide biosynthesis protein A
VTETTPSLLGAILAGGESSRFGSLKALSPLGGRPMAAWGVRALRSHFERVVVISNTPETGVTLELPSRGDLQPGMGPLGGLETALAWAEEEGLDGAFLLGCDLPLVDDHVLARILEQGFRGRPILVPESSGPLGLEPLCAAYTVDCLGPVRELLKAGRRSMMGLLETVGFSPVPVAALGGPDALTLTFMNVNTVEDSERVASLLSPEGTSP